MQVECNSEMRVCAWCKPNWKWQKKSTWTLGVHVTDKLLDVCLFLSERLYADDGIHLKLFGSNFETRTNSSKSFKKFRSQATGLLILKRTWTCRSPVRFHLKLLISLFKTTNPDHMWSFWPVSLDVLPLVALLKCAQKSESNSRFWATSRAPYNSFCLYLFSFIFHLFLFFVK